MSDLEQRLLQFLKDTHRAPVKLKSDYARANADIVAAAASLQLATTKLGPGTFGRTWLITSKGLTWLAEKEED